MRALDAALPLPSNLCKQRTVGVVPQTFCPTRQVEMVGILSIVDARLAVSAHWVWQTADWHCLLTGLTAILQLGNAPNAG